MNLNVWLTYFFLKGVSMKAISVGGFHACATTSPGGLWCWGENTCAQLGAGNIDIQDSPVQVSQVLGEYCRSLPQDHRI